MVYDVVVVVVNVFFGYDYGVVVVVVWEMV